MFTIFFNQKGPILQEFLPRGETVDADSYCDKLRHLKENVRRKRLELWRGRRLLLHHDNATPHTAAITLALIGSSGIDMVPHPPYSPDLVPADYFMFPRLKSGFRGHSIRNVADMQVAVMRELCQIDTEEFHNALNTCTRKTKMNRKSQALVHSQTAKFSIQANCDANTFTADQKDSHSHMFPQRHRFWSSSA